MTNIHIPKRRHGPADELFDLLVTLASPSKLKENISALKKAADEANAATEKLEEATAIAKTLDAARSIANATIERARQEALEIANTVEKNKAEVRDREEAAAIRERALAEREQGFENTQANVLNEFSQRERTIARKERENNTTRSALEAAQARLDADRAEFDKKAALLKAAME